MWKAPVAVAFGAAFGALLRWRLGVWLNALWPAVPPGTLIANWVGALIVGGVMGGVASHTAFASLAPEWRLFIITGFCGGLTTFSTFSAEVLVLLQASRWWEALAAVVLHLIGSLIFAALGFAAWHWFGRVSA